MPTSKKKNQTHDLIRWLHRSWPALIVGLISAACSFILVWSRLSPIKVVVTVVTPQWVTPLDKITITRAISTLRSDCRAGTLTAKIVDSEHHVLLLELPLGEKPPPIVGDITANFMVPEAISTGEAQYTSEVSYPCFPFYGWWPVKVKLPEVPFFVKARTLFELQSR